MQDSTMQYARRCSHSALASSGHAATAPCSRVQSHVGLRAGELAGMHHIITTNMQRAPITHDAPQTCQCARSLAQRVVQTSELADVSSKPVAFEWYRKGALLDNARAQCSVGACYERGDGVARDVNEAVKWCAAATAIADS